MLPDSVDDIRRGPPSCTSREKVHLFFLHSKPHQGKARFAVGDQVIDEWDERGRVTAVWSSLDDAAVDGEIDDVAEWLRGLEKKSKTPRRAVWYTVRPNTGGSMLAGERDLRPAR